MTRRRLLPPAACVALAVLAGLGTSLPALAQATGAKNQDTPTTIWQVPGAPGDLIDGVGTWVYVAPHAPQDPDQLPFDSYEYMLSFSFPGLHLGFISLSSGPEGQVARLTFSTSPYSRAEIAYPWSPGRFYFLYVHHLQDGLFGGWVMDWEAGTWAYIGSIQAPAEWPARLLTKSVRTMLWWPGAAGVAPECTGFPRTDAYFFPPLGFTGADFAISSFDFHYVTPGACPSQTDILANSWVHYRLGADPA